MHPTILLIVFVGLATIIVWLADWTVRRRVTLTGRRFPPPWSIGAAFVRKTT